MPVRAVLVISGHWETAEFAISSATFPGMVFDCCGFSEHLYHIKYDAPGSPELAVRVRAMHPRGESNHFTDAATRSLIEQLLR
jgi:aromatic ring-opening dioxygenase catalytic subunit (LigB family)